MPRGLAQDEQQELATTLAALVSRPTVDRETRARARWLQMWLTGEDPSANYFRAWDEAA